MIFITIFEEKNFSIFEKFFFAITKKSLIPKRNPRAQYFGIIEKEGQKMSKLVSQLLTLARMERGRQKLNLENINLSELIEMTVETQTLSAKSKNINVEWGGNWKMHDTPHFELK